ncbi:tesmin [Choloepus didactylus]|uniref:tesmin n=1 Tax=Choloepus didactylus TaxID=27675 RepID=UPI00189C997B|nr:tesmin [Choloepus didactylus]XP_037697290.1 tesmin [Choloepus didactylus]
MEEAPLLGGMCGPEDEIVTDLFSPENRFVSENVTLKTPVAVKHEEDRFPVFKDAYLSSADPKEPLLRAFSPPLGVDCKNKVKVELLGDQNDAEEMLGEYPGLPELSPLEEAALPSAPPPPAYNVHFLSSLLAPHRSPAVLPLGAWAREGDAQAGVRVFPVDIKEAGDTLTSNNSEEAAFQNPHTQESCCKFPSSQEPEDAPGCSLKKDSNPMLDNGSLSSIVSGSTFPSAATLLGPPKITLAGYCDCFANGDFCNNCNCNNCCNNLRHEIQRFKAIKACLDRNPEAFQPKIGKGKLGDIKPRHTKGCNCKRSGCLKNYCECYEAKIMCSSICKCIGCKNYEESPERKTLMNLPNYVETGGFEGSHHVSPTRFSGPPKFRTDRPAPSCISWEVVEATCACLLAQGEEAEKESCSQCLAEQRVLEEFGRCLSQILHIEFKSKGLGVE